VRNRLGVVLDSVRQRLVYVNLKDTRLTEDDLFFLAGWRTLAGLRELNLSCNDLQHLDQVHQRHLPLYKTQLPQTDPRDALIQAHHVMYKDGRSV